MNAKQIMDFADEHAYEPNMFNDLERTLDEEKFNILVELESNPGDKKLNRQYKDVCEKMRVVLIMRRQRLELFREAAEHQNEGQI